MGGNNVKGLYWMETMFPLPDGRSMIPPEQLQKEIAKGTIVPRQNSEQNLDGDLDEFIDKTVREIWQFYDPKNTNMMPKKVMKKFISDCLELYALRKGFKKSAEVIAPGVNKSQAMEASIAKITNNPTCTYQEFENFISCYDLDEALGAFLNVSQINVNSQVQYVDTSVFKEQAAKPKAVQYRDYSALEN
eukprot:TRINITY_DN5028_c0_g1_i1.p1 TRINITY_DN5028_c0_g1~~TRINITY_DN5028_c0_g1_i1.p1  ORF type:complete len:190 (-),score=59.49 TRINITY_DN5028_c0_g1_i1:65-634(-)